MYEKILSKNKKYISKKKSYRSFKQETTRLVNALNINKIVTVSWLRHSWKTNLINIFLEKTNSFENVFYHNSDIDTLWVIKDEASLTVLMDIYIRINGIPKIVVLQNTNNIEWIKSFIKKLYKTKKYKVIIVWNNIKIDGVEDIELFPLNITDSSINTYKYGWIPEVRIIPDNNYKAFLLEALKHDIISRDILEAYTVKNIQLFYKVLSYLSVNQEYQSLREIHRNLEHHGVEIALLTMIDYINAAINTKILRRSYRYDIKNNNTINSKAQYFFGDTGLRYSFAGDEISYLENALFLEFVSRWYEVSWAINGRFTFEFLAEKEGESFAIALAEKITDKNELRKMARKLAKIGWTSQKYIIVHDKEIYNMRKYKEDWVKIVELEELLTHI